MQFGLPAKEEESDGDETQPSSNSATHGLSMVAGFRKKRRGVGTWKILILDATGETQVLEASKHSIMRRTGVPARDLRILDPLLSYPSTVLGRERAIVVNLEHIKAIITAEIVLLQNSRDPALTPFAEELQRRILRRHRATKVEAEKGDDSSGTKPCDLEESQSGPVASEKPTTEITQFQDQDGEDEAQGKQELQNQDGTKILPFEFVALETCLEAACSVLESEAITLEQEAHPALDKLISKISTLNLERVRQIKTRLVAISKRVLQVRDELERLLDDDSDMAEMYLTDKLVKKQLENSSASSMINEDDADMVNQVLLPDIDDIDRMPPEMSSEPGESSATYEDHKNADISEDKTFGSPKELGRYSHGSPSSTSSRAVSQNLDVEEVEMILEAYFAQIDGTLNKLSTPREYVDDTEYYINVMLDDKQNKLLKMEVMLSLMGMIFSAFLAVTDTFGTQIKIELFDEKKAGTREFLWTIGGTFAGCIFLYVLAIAWAKHKRLLESN